MNDSDLVAAIKRELATAAEHKAAFRAARARARAALRELREVRGKGVSMRQIGRDVDCPESILRYLLNS